MADETVLSITGIDVQPYSARGLKQSFAPLGANLRRTINGALRDLSAPQFRKYSSTITGADQTSPALNGIWTGKLVTVDCLGEFSYKTAGGAADRTVVPGSSRVDGAFTFYRPRLSMRVTNYAVDVDEYGAQVSWSLELEEA